MPCPRSRTLALVVLGTGLGACFSDPGAPSPTSESGLAGTSTTSITSTTSATTTEATTTTTTTEEATSTGCVPTVWYFDIDKDGFGGPKSTLHCGSPGPDYIEDSLDCDDSNPAINPKAAEKCDAVDNDCDGGIDEYPANAVLACNGCRSLVGTTSVYHYCDGPSDWAGARTRCMSLLGDLVSINDDGERTLVHNNVGNAESGFWIGLADLALGGKMVWVDGSPLPPGFAMWGDLEPDNAQNCVILGLLNRWYDVVCEEPHALICEALLPT